jgi:hypothetical protein
MAVFYKIVKLVKLGVLMIIHIYAKVSYYITLKAIRATNATGTGKTSTLKIGDKIIVTVTLSETVVVTGEPTYTISMGGVNKSATYVSTASNANILVFSYTIASGDMTTTGLNQQHLRLWRQRLLCLRY